MQLLVYTKHAHIKLKELVLKELPEQLIMCPFHIKLDSHKIAID